MTIDTEISTKIEKIVLDLSSALETMKKITGMVDHSFKTINTLCRMIPDQIGSGILNIAVVGAIKSGKSTFINSWLNDDLLKRGAGVVTSVITRVKKGDQHKATVLLKSWDEINQEISKALLLFPAAGNTVFTGSGFDLRRKKDRVLLKKMREQVYSDLSVTEKGFRPELITISHAIEGYETVKTFIKAEPSYIELTHEAFEKHKLFTGDEAAALFVRGVLLTVNSSRLDPNVEIADCQGSDSTDPSHLAQIQDYLVSANLIIYMISSRTGLREADIKFLRTIQTMGLLDTMVFVVNADINEHESLEDLLSVEKKINRELSFITADPEIYTISSLYNLFHKSRSALPRKDRQRLEQWKQEDELISFTDEMTGEFNNMLNRRLDKERFNLLVANHIERLRLGVDAAVKRVNLFIEFFSNDLSKAQAAVNSLKELLYKAGNLEVIMTNSMDGTVEEFKSGMKTEIKLLFDKTHGRIAKKIKQFIQGCFIDYDHYEREFKLSGFDNAIYFMFQDFRAKLDTFLTEEFNPEIICFIHEQEQKMERHFNSIYQSFYIDPSDIYSEFSAIGEKISQDSADENPASFVPVDVKTIRGILGLKLPQALFATRYSARIRVDSLVKFGFHSMAGVLAKLFKKEFKAPGARALRDAGKRIKKESLRSIMLHLDEYKFHITNDYLFTLLNAVSRNFNDKLMDRFQICHVEIEKIEKLFHLEQSEKKNQTRTLQSLKTDLKDIFQRIDELHVLYLN